MDEAGEAVRCLGRTIEGSDSEYWGDVKVELDCCVMKGAGGPCVGAGWSARTIGSCS
jgi:hypothetical protein